nr:MAG TPA: integrase [Caudoviricetes sp.]
MEKKAETVRCAIYCRKSVEKGLDMEFNSLDAQREAAEAYIASQKINGWVCLPEHYDDGGFSGGNMNRPALKQLLRDAEAGKLDLIVVYKIDRLSRSLCDFAELNKLFDKCGVAFVSVTQEINTNTSTGRMMLNILMTFAQFEREMSAMRVKDKMAATRKKGKWAGGSVPIGYKAVDKKLVIDEERASIVKRIFRRYLEIQSPKQIAWELNADGITTLQGKKWDTPHIYRIINNCTYTGRVFYDGQIWPGEHQPIIDMDTWKMAQSFLKTNTPFRDNTRKQKSIAPLKGILRCGHCNSSMIPVKSRRWGREYHYYHCCRDMKRSLSICPVKQISAGEIEKMVIERLKEILNSPEILIAVARQTGMRANEIGTMFSKEFWEEITPGENQRLMQILLEQVTVNEDGVVMEIRTAGIESITEAYNDQQNS